MVTYYRYKNEKLGMEFSDIPELYRNLIRKEYIKEVKEGLMTIERYEELTKESYAIKEVKDIG